MHGVCCSFAGCFITQRAVLGLIGRLMYSLVAFHIWCIIVNNEGERRLFNVANKQT